jgi:hypothetical protein
LLLFFSINAANKIKNHTELSIKIRGTNTGLTKKDKINIIVGGKNINKAIIEYFTDLFLNKNTDRRMKLWTIIIRTTPVNKVDMGKKAKRDNKAWIISIIPGV